MAYVLAPLPYAYDALNPHVDTKTMEVHHDFHHKAYTDKLNGAIQGTAYESLTIEELLKQLDNLPEDIRNVVRNNGGWYYNHNHYWNWMSPAIQSIPSEFEASLTKYFGSVDQFKEKFTNAGLNQFGSWWAWLVKTNEWLSVYSTPNQDNPVMKWHTPILWMDVWEHAYYLKHQNKRWDYIKDFWNVVNWKRVVELYNDYHI